MSRVVNVKVAHIRPEYSLLKNWCSYDENVYIGRRGVVFVNEGRFPKKDSIWCNPFKIGKNQSREDVIALYREHILDRLRNKVCYNSS